MSVFCVYVCVGEKEVEDKDLNSEAPSSLSEATSEKEANSVSQSNTVSLRKEEDRSNSIKKVGHYFEDFFGFWNTKIKYYTTMNQ